MTHAAGDVIAANLLRPDWPAPRGVDAVSTTRHGGVSQAGMASLNLAAHVGDSPAAVEANRNALKASLGIAEPRWLNQVHGADVVHADKVTEGTSADAAWTSTPGVVCAILTADCLPVIVCDRRAQFVAVAHAGWRGLCAGVLANTVRVYVARGGAPQDLLVWLGPAISAASYEVGADVRDAFLRCQPDCATCFTASGAERWHFDLYKAAQALLSVEGVGNVSGGGFCTRRDDRFFSYRGDAGCGRQATLIWLQESGL